MDNVPLGPIALSPEFRARVAREAVDAEFDKHLAALDRIDCTDPQVQDVVAVVHWLLSDDAVRAAAAGRFAKTGETPADPAAAAAPQGPIE